jgi:hypothetical protein
LLDSELVALACALPRACIHAEAIPFLAMRRSGLPLDAQPFAGDAWRGDLQGALHRLGVRAEVSPQVPVTTPPGLRLLADPHRPGPKVELLRLMAPAASRMVHEQRADLPFLDIAATTRAFRAAAGTPPGVREMISLLGVATIVLLREYGLDLFDRDRREELRRDLAARTTPGPGGVAGGGPGAEVALRDLVAARDDALAAMAEERHLLQCAVADARPAPSAARRLFRLLPSPVRDRLRLARRRLRRVRGAGLLDAGDVGGTASAPRPPTWR